MHFEKILYMYEDETMDTSCLEKKILVHSVMQINPVDASFPDPEFCLKV